MKRTLLSSCVLGLALSLTACGGGGGGGGSSGIGTTFTISGMAGNATRQSTPALTNANQTASALASSGSGVQDQLKSVSGFDPWGNRDLVLKVESNGSLTLKYEGQTVTNFKPADMRFYKKDGVDFAVMMDTPHPSTDPNVKASLTEKNALWIGKLDYVSFGYWAQIWDGQGTYNSVQYRGTAIADYDYFHDGKKAQYVGGNLSFTGVAAGIAEYWTEADGVTQAGTIPLIGTANLTIANATNGSLVLTFPNFYQFTGKVTTTTANGHFSGSFTNAQKLGSASPVDLPNTVSQLEYNELNGQLYGSSPTNPTEAAGHWYLEYETKTKGIHVDGVFGVKKK